ncbi:MULTISPECIES: CCA tRNA nucleotidyltransferase [unclassified Brevundimonas]|uniref:CCA tRNA nucleotidyltransferase n=1 Tax=unclassified Brevundimonas TaxID=2622653 RepID=UPI000CFAAAFC|nr:MULTISPECIES: CCA tRNA nucleotidyltransferase [unclassified Brevundimonas]PRA22375.1 CCA tRNA nucleotidyltransferase [Brevundimonas sp. MYb27]PQZ74072.1 CCA tRNA nucleotidyltransferase [Brevundimonas sp. MYb31]PRB10797.1 CCA tRNA nucleotidyltransferase [Brevundimonas sp. MYb52]PRB32414.1 CCA tRNA nucleotidyltransferase [Brevundimonas sp. MYb46]PRB50284.1 CCA tRNA nucleotidyltransferase [Brevundimonas sp. MYb33]
MSHRLQGQDWLTASATRAVMAALAAAGGPDCARFVGGCVRNALIGAPIDDIDIATLLTPDAVVAALKAAGLRSVPTGIEHGTVTGLSEHQPFEITTLRRDVSTDGRRATVAFTTDWAEDAGRRDFRLNALYADADGVILDPTGLGYDDALAGRIVFVGEPEGRIREDYLRILRFYRFYAWYGRGEPDAAAVAACAALAEGVEQLSAERVSKELLKLLAAPDPRHAVRLMDEAGVLGRVLGQPGDLTLFEAMTDLSGDAVLRLSTLLPDDPACVGEIARGLRLSNAQRDRQVEAVSGTATTVLSEPQARAIIYRDGRQAFEDRVMRAWAAGGDAKVSRRLLALAQAWSRPSLPVGGRDLARLGLKPGPETGRVLKAFEAGWIADDFPDHGHEERLRALLPPA